MDFLEYKNYLIKYNIKLFDCDYRISFNNMFVLNDNIFKSNQQGGGKSNSLYYISPFTIIKKGNENVINKLVSNLIVHNFNGAKFVCQENFTLKVN